MPYDCGIAAQGEPSSARRTHIDTEGTSIREIEGLGEQEFSPAETLTTATATPARMLGIDAGTIQVGQVGDLAVDDPLADGHALRNVRYAVWEGDARTPRERMGKATAGTMDVRSPKD